MYCNKCGKKLHKDDVFCGKCGTKINKLRFTDTPPSTEAIKATKTEDVQSSSKEATYSANSNAKAKIIPIVTKLKNYSTSITESKATLPNITVTLVFSGLLIGFVAFLIFNKPTIEDINNYEKQGNISKITHILNTACDKEHEVSEVDIEALKAFTRMPQDTAWEKYLETKGKALAEHKELHDIIGGYIVKGEIKKLKISNKIIQPSLYSIEKYVPANEFNLLNALKQVAQLEQDFSSKLYNFDETIKEITKSYPKTDNAKKSYEYAQALEAQILDKLLKDIGIDLLAFFKLPADIRTTVLYNGIAYLPNGEYRLQSYEAAYKTTQKFKAKYDNLINEKKLKETEVKQLISKKKLLEEEQALIIEKNVVALKSYITDYKLNSQQNTAFNSYLADHTKSKNTISNISAVGNINNTNSQINSSKAPQAKPKFIQERPNTGKRYMPQNKPPQ